MKTRANLAAYRVVSTFTVPLHIPYGYRYLRFLGEDPGDDALLFTGMTRDLEESLLICVERTSGSVRYIVKLPSVDVDFDTKPNVGLFGGEGFDERFEAYISGRAFNHLCHGLDASLPRDRYLQKFGSFLNQKFDFTPTNCKFEGDVDNCGEHLGVSRVYDQSIQWEHLAAQTLAKERWDVSTAPYTYLRGVSSGPLC